MADLARSATAGAAEREGDIARIGHQAQGIPALAPEVEVAVIAALGRSVDRPFGQHIHRERPQPLDMRRIGVEAVGGERGGGAERSEEHTSELQSLMRISYAVFCLKKKKNQSNINQAPPVVKQCL